MMEPVTQIVVACSVLFTHTLAHPTAIQPHIIGGQEVGIKEVSYMAAMYHYGSFRCGGSVISPWHILTAAHCLRNPFLTPADVTFRIGSASNLVGGQVLQVASYVLHPRFDPVWLDFDVAVVKLAKSITDFRNVSLVVLPDESFSIANNEVVSVAGWGLTEAGSYPEFVRKVDVPILDHEACESIYGEPISDNMICAGVPGKDSCNGDSGSPLIYEKDGKVIQPGLVSFGPIACGTHLGVYAKIAHPEIRSFIREQMEEDCGCH